jgi:hypothetical protein
MGVRSVGVRGRCSTGVGGVFVRCVMGGVGLARPRSVRPRTVVIAVRVTPAEAAVIDRARGTLSRSEWVRWLLLRQKKA